MGSVPDEGVAAEAGAVVRAVVPAVPVLEGGPSKKPVTSVSFHSKDGEGAVKYVVVVSDLLLNVFQTHDVDLYF
jgi:hypothetical protein